MKNSWASIKLISNIHIQSLLFIQVQPFLFYWLPHPCALNVTCLVTCWVFFWFSQNIHSELSVCPCCLLKTKGDDRITVQVGWAWETFKMWEKTNFSWNSQSARKTEAYFIISTTSGIKIQSSVNLSGFDRDKIEEVVSHDDAEIATEWISCSETAAISYLFEASSKTVIELGLHPTQRWKKFGKTVRLIIDIYKVVSRRMCCLLSWTIEKISRLQPLNWILQIVIFFKIRYLSW